MLVHLYSATEKASISIHGFMYVLMKMPSKSNSILQAKVTI